MTDAPSPSQMAATHAAAFTQSRPWRTGEFAELLTSPLSLVVGDERCFSLFRVIADEAELLTIATHPDHQRQGLARACLSRAEVELRLRGVTEVFLEVAADNAPAQSLYLSAGFAKCGLRREYYPRPGAQAVDALLMRKALR
ncbi:GNAT family N-acetyltransferase [Leisingera sp.]|uniref:GNAT family N-acetyltransferase n=1 Tax=Leisingera sp. TaxID=1879318 RepID=UPI003A954D36